jgi:hypothetical protein
MAFPYPSGCACGTNRTHPAAFTGRLRVPRLIARPDHHADLLHLRRQGLLDQNPKDGFLLPVPVDESLQRKRPLILAGSRDHRFLDSHCDAPLTV